MKARLATLLIALGASFAPLSYADGSAPMIENAVTLTATREGNFARLSWTNQDVPDSGWEYWAITYGSLFVNPNRGQDLKSLAYPSGDTVTIINDRSTTSYLHQAIDPGSLTNMNEGFVVRYVVCGVSTTARRCSNVKEVIFGKQFTSTTSTPTQKTIILFSKNQTGSTVSTGSAPYAPPPTTIQTQVDGLVNTLRAKLDTKFGTNTTKKLALLDALRPQAKKLTAKNTRLSLYLDQRLMQLRAEIQAQDTGVSQELEKLFDVR